MIILENQILQLLNVNHISTYPHLCWVIGILDGLTDPAVLCIYHSLNVLWVRQV